MQQYLDLLSHVLENGDDRQDRTGTGTRGVFGYQMRFDLQAGFPCLTTKKLHLKSIIHELLWFLRGETNVESLNAVGVRIWNEWADDDGELGPIYGRQWRAWPTNAHDQGSQAGPEPIDQIARLIEGIKTQPYSRRHIVSAWNVAQIDEMALPPCHCLFQFYVSQGRLSCQLYQRSADIFLGVPFNIASYALLTMMIARYCNLLPGDFVHSFGDAHIYRNHIEQAKLQLTRTPRTLPSMAIKGHPDHIDGFAFEDFELTGYDPHPHIPAPISV